MDFFGIGLGEVLLILIIALIVFGPGRLPEIARTIGRVSRNLKKMTTEFTTAMNKEISLEEEKNKKTGLNAEKGQKNLPDNITTGENLDQPSGGTGNSKT